MRKCIKCGKEKSDSEFYTHQNHCKECEHKRRKKYYSEHRENEIKQSIDWKMRNKKRADVINTRYSKNRRARIRLEVLTYYGGNPPKCACCGEQHIEFLTIDHIHGGGNEHRRKLFGSKSVAGSRFYYWLKKNNFPRGFQVLCYNCNCAKAYCGICPHQREKLNRKV